MSRLFASRLSSLSSASLAGLLALSAASALSVGTGCGSDPVKPGSLVARWDLSPSSCDMLHLTKINARAEQKDEVQNEATVACTDSGEVTLDALTPGVYTLVIEGLNGDPTPRATHRAIQENVRVSEAKETKSDVLRLSKKPARLHLRWVFTDGLRCVDNDVKTVKVEIFDDGNQLVTDKVDDNPSTVDCDATFVDKLDEGKEKSGVLFEALPGESTLNILVSGINEAGDIVRKGQVNNLLLLAGDNKIETVKLCAQTPCE